MKLAELRSAGRSPQLPLVLHLPVGQVELRRWLRVLPNRRYVALAEWQNRRVLAKLLVGCKAARHYRRECAGATALAEQGLASPALLAAGYRAAAGGWLLFDYLEGAVTLGSRWHEVAAQPPLSTAQEVVLGAALEAIGTLHAKGLWQDDLHLDNLLWHNQQVVWVDAGSIRSAKPGRPLPDERALVNLGVFFAQLPARFQGFIGPLLERYLLGGGRPGLSVDVLQRRVISLRHGRLREYLGKVGRECTLFSVHRGPTELRVVRRDVNAILQPLLADLDRYMDQGDILKAGGSSTVARISLDGRQLVVKRYNLKGLSHWLRRFWRPSRAWHAWREGHRLAFLGLGAPRPLAMLERRCCWLRRRAYLVMEYLDGENIRRRFAPYVNSSPPPAEMSALVNLFEDMVRERISHGDLKGTNLLWNGGSWVFIDLDVMRQHRSQRTFARAYARDRARLLRNWPADSALFRMLDERIPVL